MTTEVTIVIRDDFGLDQEAWEREVEDFLADRGDGCTLVALNVEEV